LITIGNELLIGKILNTNMCFLAKAVTDLGGNVTRATTVRDDVDEISSAINEALNRKTDFIIACGGLGPTFDDKTLEAFSKAIDRPLELNEVALEYLKERYRRRYGDNPREKFELTSSRLKMVRLPRSATPLRNPVGSAPGVYVKHRETVIVALPGVPEEMQAIFEQSVVPLIRELVGNIFRSEGSLKVTGLGESKVAPLIDTVMLTSPNVYIKSHPRHGQGPTLELHLSIVSESEDVAKNSVKRAMEELSRLVADNGGEVELMKT